MDFLLHTQPTIFAHSFLNNKKWMFARLLRLYVLIPSIALQLAGGVVTAVGFEPTHPKIVELESTALDHSAKLSMSSI